MIRPLRVSFLWIPVVVGLMDLAASTAQAQQADRKDWIAPPLEAIGKALNKFRDLGDRPVAPAAQPRRKRQTSKIRQAKPKPQAVATRLARLPRSRPGELPAKLASLAEERPPESQVPQRPVAPEIPPQEATGPALPTSQAKVELSQSSQPPEPSPPALPSAMVVPAPPPLASDVAATPPRFPPQDAAGTVVSSETSARLPQFRRAASASPILGPTPDGGVNPVAPAPPAAASTLAATPPRFPTQEVVAPAAAPEAAARLPRTRPDGSTPADLASLPPDQIQTPEIPPNDVSVPSEPSPDETACLERLSSLGVDFREINPIDPGGLCPVPAPLEVASLGSGVAITPKAILNCRTAEAFALWVRDVVITAARTHLDSVPTEIAQASSYVCRPRNGDAEAKLSEHAKASAIDIGTIGFANRPPHIVETRASDEQEGRFAVAIREGACKYFTTVLGPGSDAAHADHLHLDISERRGGYRICELGEGSMVRRED